MILKDIFAVVQNGIDRNAYFLDAKYNDAYGYPTDIWVDFDPLMAGGEDISVTVSLDKVE